MAIIISSSMSDSGKSLVTAGLTKHFRSTPFKAQNMSLNSFPTRSGGEIAFIQAYQAMGSGLEPERYMNPVLLKPSGNGIEVIFMGDSLGNLAPSLYYSSIEKFWEKIKGLIKNEMIIESAGGVGEPNFMERDISGYRLMREGIPSILVLDIDRGGAFASAYGIYNMMPSSIRNTLKGFIINKFRGEEKFLDPAVRWLEDKTSMKFMGVIPYDHRLKIMAEDSMNISDLGDGELEVAVVAYPYMSNFNELHAFSKSNATLRFVTRPSQLSKADLVILPGTRNTKASLDWLIQNGFPERLRNKKILGICGGFQIMGRKLIDPYGLEAGEPAEYQGLGFLPVNVKFQKEKVVSLSLGVSDVGEITGYEIRRGKVEYEGWVPLLTIKQRNNIPVEVEDGADAGDKIGISIHGALYSEGGKKLLERFGIKIYSGSLKQEVTESVDLIYRILRDRVDLSLIEQIYRESETNSV
ncbi:cobyric acid synthase [Metallosphaera tengchongensis]|uniref:Probable cobyric acid synthase n=1 Tax=Metallosphaera tengchongensis TaxID=1532350 RepID=A0A6N0NWK6_9CREN|nr:cobyric acid synthase [Metallosphaera tengchongensis]QKR00019.1 cobyric acid synthase [Metallosphaera tengchongensis]